MISLTKELYNDLIAYAQSNYPNECCGYFLGKQDKITLQNQVEELFKIKNIHQNPQHFFMLSPQDQLNALQRAKKQNLEIIGIFHSHPFNKAYPSKEDLKYIYDPRQSYCIISLQNEPNIASFRITKEKICEETIKF
ncbi:hypothetical protein BKH41_01045 [Helicobacter sp. 12S02232-10]|uniref:M67 family metallopeptidase n=1 Tax=Helicobacter sp. 12S02232-10 TaxID=1476197 RepID=UPI000BCD4755|nr:M67 family metallopeptidase [Helicobacter sp. 12S02232-10]PAF49918.1 hypothetical protein BKH41_01045 [Helicobacter sp. 12S02232-10]